MGSVALDSDALDQLHGEQKALLDTIDDLRKHGIQRFVDLPQIIVVGDQSSGKSSVLEAISRVRFPVKDGLCTRFATELVLRTDPQTRVDVQTQPSVTSGKEAHVFNETGFDQDEFPRIIEDAKNRMLQGSAAFSEDVLRVVISGPDVPHLTMVDLPGFYHSEDENQSAADRELVDRLVEHYMARKHSIILAIVSARNQVILQRVLSKVKQHDKKRVRTLGIITKPDLLVTGSKEEDSFLRLAKNLDKSHQLSLGWHVLRNRGETEGSYSHEERDQKEEDFFNEGVWHTIPSRNRGVRPLRKRLSTILLEHIKGNLQGVINGIEEQMIDRQNQLKALGQPRSTTPEMQAHLDRIASRFHILSLQAIEGNYSDDFFGGLFTGSNASSIDSNRVKKLRAFVRDMHHAFTYVLGTKGSTRVIVDDELDDHPYRGSDDDDEEDSDDVDQEEESVDDQENCNRLGAGKELLAPPLRPLVAQYKLKAPKKVTFDSIAAELELLASANQGNEFPGTANDRIAVQFFKDQAQPWESIARFHLHLVLKYTKGFVENVIQHVAGPDERTASTVLSEIIDPFFEEREALLESKLQELLKHFRRGYPQPLDTQFRRLLASRRRKKLTNQMMQNLLSERPELFTNEAAERLEEGPSAAPEGRFAVGELIDKAETYYDMSLRTFADNIIVLAVENCLVTEIPSIFTTEMVCQMSSEEVKRLGAEAPEIQVERTEVQAEYDALRKGLTLCNKYRARGATGKQIDAAPPRPSV
ncbi:hypothetical protein F4780DRAFT_11423 [Xylariomycetidae sp. FL0641]|nr:hypothetical protein F4780DRAFT_11423 [Xylariomycetidae sp. FL0641]